MRELTRLVSTEMRKQGTQDVRSPEERWATALEAIKTNLRNSIADMSKRLETGEKPAKRVSTPLDVEAKALKAQRDALAQTLREIEGPRKLTDQERIQMGERGLEKSITDLDERIKSGQLSPKSRTSAPWSAKISELQKQRKVLADTLKAMRDAAKPPKDKDAALLKAFKTRTAKSINEYQRRLDEGDFTTTKRKPVNTPLFVTSPSRNDIFCDAARVAR